MYILYFIDILSHGLKSHLGTYRIKVQEKSPVFFPVVSNSWCLSMQREESRAVRMCKSSSRCQAGCCQTKTRGTETDCLPYPFDFF